MRFARETMMVFWRGTEEAKALGHRRIGTGHVLLGFLSTIKSSEPPAPFDLGVSHDQVRAALMGLTRFSAESFDDMDADALKTLGISLEEVRRRVEETHGPGALDRIPIRRGRRDITDAAKQALKMAMKEARQLGHRRTKPAHLLLALLNQPGPTAAQLILDQVGVDQEALRRTLIETTEAA